MLWKYHDLALVWMCNSAGQETGGSDKQTVLKKDCRAWLWWELRVSGCVKVRSFCARDRRAGDGCPEQPAGPGRAVPRQEALCGRVNESLPLVLPCLLRKLPAGGRTCRVGSGSFNVVFFLNAQTRRHTRTQAYFQSRLWFVVVFSFSFFF